MAPLTATSYLCHLEGTDEPCSASDYAENRQMLLKQARTGQVFVEATSNPRLDALAPGGPAVPATQPTPATCNEFTQQVNKWAAYQNSHRPAGAPRLPTNAQQAYLNSGCQMGPVGD